MSKSILVGFVISLLLVSCGKEETISKKVKVEEEKPDVEQLAKEIDSLKQVINIKNDSLKIQKIEAKKEEFDIEQVKKVAEKFLKNWGGVFEEIYLKELVTKNFIKKYKAHDKYCAEYWEKYMSLGDNCDYDIVVGNQDPPGDYVFYDIIEKKDKEVYMMLVSQSRRDDKVIVKVIYENGKYKVDGSGGLNIPEKFYKYYR